MSRENWKYWNINFTFNGKTEIFDNYYLNKDVTQEKEEDIYKAYKDYRNKNSSTTPLTCNFSIEGKKCGCKLLIKKLPIGLYEIATFNNFSHKEGCRSKTELWKNKELFYNININYLLSLIKQRKKKESINSLETKNIKEKYEKISINEDDIIKDDSKKKIRKKKTKNINNILNYIFKKDIFDENNKTWKSEFEFAYKKQCFYMSGKNINTKRWVNTRFYNLFMWNWKFFPKINYDFEKDQYFLNMRIHNISIALDQNEYKIIARSHEEKPILLRINLINKDMGIKLKKLRVKSKLQDLNYSLSLLTEHKIKVKKINNSKEWEYDNIFLEPIYCIDNNLIAIHKEKEYELLSSY